MGTRNRTDGGVMSAGDTYAGVATNAEYREALVQGLDQDEELRSSLSTATTAPPEEAEVAKDPESETHSSFWQRLGEEPVLETDGKLGDKQANDLFASVGRGVLGAVNEGAEAIVDVATTISKNTGLYKLDRTPEEEAAFLRWYEMPDSERPEPGAFTDQGQGVPLTLTQARIDKWFGPSRGGGYGFVENVSQFATGYFMATKLLKAGEAIKPLKPALEALKEGGKAMSFLSTSLKGAITDMTFFDPHMKRISNLVEDLGASNPVSRFLAAEDDDSNAEGRLKAGLEGFMVGTTLEVFFWGLRGYKALRAYQQGKMTKEAAEAVVAESAAKAAEVEPGKGANVQVVELPDGQFGVVKNADAEASAVATKEGKGAGNGAAPAAVVKAANRGEAESIASSVEYAKSNESLGLSVETSTDPALMDVFLKARTEIRAGTEPREVAQILENYGVNVKYAQQPDEVVDVIRAIAGVWPEPSVMLRNKPKTWAETAKDAAELLQVPEDQALRNLRRVFGTTEDLDAQVHGMKTWMWMHARQTEKLAQMVEAAPTNAIAMDQLAKSLDTMLEFHAYSTGTSANLARGLNAHKMPLGEAVEKLGATQAKGADAVHRAPPGRLATEGLTKDQVRALARSVLQAEGDPGAILNALRGAKMEAAAAKVADPVLKKSMLQKAIGFRMEAMLSGIRTFTTNITANMYMALEKPAAMWWAGAMTRNNALREEGADAMIQMFRSMGESWTAARKSFAMGKNVLDPGSAVSDAGSSMAAWKDASWLQRVYHAPSRSLMAADEFFKQMNYRGATRAKILRDARAEGITDPAELAKRLSDDMEFKFGPEGAGVDQRSLEYAQDATFTSPLGDGTMGASVQKFVNDHPGARLVMPFVRTPIQIFRKSWKMTPILNRYNKQMAAELAAGGERAAIAKAHMDFATATWSTAALLVLGGQVTGRGPGDPELRKQWLEAGHQPYSFKVGDRWVSYRRGDPATASFGLVADLVSMSGEMKADDFGEYSAAVLASIASNVTSKTFMQGVTDFSDALSSGQGHKAEKLLQNMAASFTPNILRQSNPDSTLRETEGYLDEFLVRIPGLSTTLPPRRNLLGEKVMKSPGFDDGTADWINKSMNPFTIAKAPEAEDVYVQEELLKLGKAFTMPSQYAPGTDGMIDLKDRNLFGPDRNGQDPYDRMSEFMANPGEGRPSLREALAKVISNPTWRTLSDSSEVKYDTIKGVISSYRQMAWGQVLKEYPTLDAAYKQAMQAKGYQRALGDEGTQSVIKKQNRPLINPRRRGPAFIPFE